MVDENPLSWHNNNSLLFIDSPVGTGKIKYSTEIYSIPVYKYIFNNNTIYLTDVMTLWVKWEIVYSMKIHSKIIIIRCNWPGLYTWWIMINIEIITNYELISFEFLILEIVLYKWYFILNIEAYIDKCSFIFCLI